MSEAAKQKAALIAADLGGSELSHQDKFDVLVALIAACGVPN
jgi:hypothetical protein